MINLIPPHARKQVKVEYWIRVFSVWILLITAACTMFGLLLIPSIVLIQSQLHVYDGAYQTANDQNNIYEQLEQDVRIANEVAQQLSSIETFPLFTTVISDLESVAKDRVTLSSVSFTRNEEDVVEQIQIVGTANSRSLLVQFRDALESHVSFDSAELPLSSLAKDKDVPFSITILVSSNISQ